MNECYPLQGKVVDLNGAFFFVHGIVHENPLVSISEEFKEELNIIFRGYSVICEDGISSWIKGSKSFNEAHYFNFDNITLSGYFHFLKGFIHNKFTKKTPETPLAKMVKGLRKVEDLSSIRKYLFKNYLEEPEGMNLLMSKNNSGSIDAPKGEIPLRIKRYVYETKKAMEYAKDNSLEELHIIVGCAHERPLEYLLKNNRLLDRFP